MQNSERSFPKHFVASIEETPILAVDKVDEDAAPSNLWRDAWRSMRGRAMFWISLFLIVLIAVVSFFPYLFTAEEPNANCQLANSNAGPTEGHPFGFTKQGCDVFARVIHGTSASVTVGLLATIIVVLIGAIFGALAGFYGGVFDAILSRLGDIFFAIPVVLGAIVLMQTIPGTANAFTVALILAVFGWPQVARITRGAVLASRNSDYVTASIALGVTRFRVLLRHVFPNSLAPVIVIATVSLGSYIVAGATLSFLGVGLPPSVMSWGNDIADAQISIRTNPQALLYPAGALSITVLSFLMLGDVVKDALDPRARAR